MSTRYSQQKVQEWGATTAPATEAQNAIGQSTEINRLLTAAVVSRRFCQLLLANPVAALTAGYRGEAFRLNAEEMHRVTTIRASSLQDFARQLLQSPEPDSDAGHTYEPYSPPVRLAFSTRSL